MTCEIKKDVKISLELTVHQAEMLKCILQNAPEGCDSSFYSFYGWLFNQLPTFDELRDMGE